MTRSNAITYINFAGFRRVAMIGNVFTMYGYFLMNNNMVVDNTRDNQEDMNTSDKVFSRSFVILL